MIVHSVWRVFPLLKPSLTASRMADSKRVRISKREGALVSGINLTVSQLATYFFVRRTAVVTLDPGVLVIGDIETIA